MSVSDDIDEGWYKDGDCGTIHEWRDDVWVQVGTDAWRDKAVAEAEAVVAEAKAFLKTCVLPERVKLEQPKQPNWLRILNSKSQRAWDRVRRKRKLREQSVARSKVCFEDDPRPVIEDVRTFPEQILTRRKFLEKTKDHESTKIERCTIYGLFRRRSEAHDRRCTYVSRRDPYAKGSFLRKQRIMDLQNRALHVSRIVSKTIQGP